MTDLRRAAVSLYGLSDEDRGWVLERLGEDDSERLEELLGELADLGFPRESAEMVSAAEESHEQAVSSVARIDGASAKQMLQVLQGSHRGLIASLLHGHPWRWRRRFLKACSEDRRRILQRGQPVRVSARVVSQILSSVDDALLQAGPARSGGLFGRRPASW